MPDDRTEAIPLREMAEGFLRQRAAALAEIEVLRQDKEDLRSMLENELRIALEKGATWEREFRRMEAEVERLEDDVRYERDRADRWEAAAKGKVRERDSLLAEVERLRERGDVMARALLDMLRRPDDNRNRVYAEAAREAWERSAAGWEARRASPSHHREWIPMPADRVSLTHTRTHTVCGHPSDKVVADILSGDFHGGPGGDQAVQWCRGCGAYRRVFDRYGEHRCTEWRSPDARS